MLTVCSALLLFRHGEKSPGTATFEIPEVLIGENSSYVVEYNSLHRPAQMRRFFLPFFQILLPAKLSLLFR
ncbi:hypothetical protein D6029_02455 [Buttiauxella izardii]|uniref:Uncharacterized protein n=1 Tax=Buttiauxella izardii TaxID=82991 RepID=A0A3A5JYQ3_9ENTR|nr:hypothetical protein D6029_02455 [Buttiauxella izardii]